MYHKMIPCALGVLLMIVAAVRFASNADLFGAGIALIAAFLASFTAFRAAQK